MNRGDPQFAKDPVVDVLFPIDEILFDDHIMAWLNDNQKYHEFSRSSNPNIVRRATFKNFDKIISGSSFNKLLI